MTIQRQLSPMQNRRIGICFRLLRRPGIQDDLRASLTSHIGPDPNGAKISIAFVEDGGELHAFYDGVLSGMDKPWAGVSWLLARNG